MKTMNLAKEISIRKLENKHLNTMMDLWHSSIQEKLGRDMEILVGNRRKHPALSAFKGLNTQVTVSNLGKETHLVIWYDPYELLYAEMLAELGYGEALINKIGPMLDSGLELGPEYEPAVNLDKLDWDPILRRLGLWVLRVEGFKKVANRQGKYAELDSLVNTECRTPPLNSLLKKIGYEYEEGLSAIVDDTIEGMSAMDSEPPRRMDRAVNALRLWNLTTACSKKDRDRIEAVLAASFPRIGTALYQTGELAREYDILSPEGNLAFTLAFIKENRLPGDWETVDEIKEMMKSI